MSAVSPEQQGRRAYLTVEQRAAAIAASGSPASALTVSDLLRQIETLKGEMDSIRHSLDALGIPEWSPLGEGGVVSLTTSERVKLLASGLVGAVEEEAGDDAKPGG